MNDLQSILIAEVIATERKWAEAHGELDLDTIAHILSEDYRQIQSDGSVIGKKELIESYQFGGRMWEVAKSSGYRVRLF